MLGWENDALRQATRGWWHDAQAVPKWLDGGLWHEAQALDAGCAPAHVTPGRWWHDAHPDAEWPLGGLWHEAHELLLGCVNFHDVPLSR